MASCPELPYVKPHVKLLTGNKTKQNIAKKIGYTSSGIYIYIYLVPYKIQLIGSTKQNIKIIMIKGGNNRSLYTHQNLFEILLNQTEFRLYLPFSVLI